VYDNRRAVDYLQSRPEVDGTKLGITGASGGGNQTMYAGALDERFKAVVPVCSVGRYQSYLRAACCVCEVLPGALRFTEEGDVLGLVAPRGLLVINATKDAYQFSVGEAIQSLQRTKAIYKLYSADEKVRHDTFESPHAYNQAMREAMYGWMTRWLKNEGAGKPIPEPKHLIEKAEDLAVFPDGVRPAGFLFPPTFAAREAQRLLAPFRTPKLDHKEAWDARALQIRAELGRVLGPIPPLEKAVGKFGKGTKVDNVYTNPLTLQPEPGVSLTVHVRFKDSDRGGGVPAAVLLHLDGKEEALKHPLAVELVNKDWAVYAPDLRATGASRPKGDGIAAAPDHNSAEHAIWVGRPLLGQWVVDVRCVLAFMAAQRGLVRDRLTVIGLGQAGLVALVAGGLIDQASSVAAVGAPVSFVTGAAYPSGTRMGLLAPGILRAGDVPHLAGLSAPRKLLLAGGTGTDGKKLTDKALQTAFAFPRKAYRLAGAEERLKVRASETASELIELL
jgi:pimeloyl-ACP methyl ester carboxylesterase